MLRKIIAFSINNKFLIGLFVLALIGLGLYELQRLPIDAVPDITNNQIQVITVAPALGATDVERLITIPIEQTNQNIPHLIELRSYSSFGLSVVTLVFDDKVDVYWARQQISERLIQLQEILPKGFGAPFLAPVSTGLGEIYQYVVKPTPGYEEQYSAMDLREIQDWMVRKQLLGVAGVAEVSSFGGALKQYELAIIPEQLHAYHITIADVFDALAQNNANTGGAYIEKGPTALFIKSEGLVQSLDDLAQIVVKILPNGKPLLLKDVATIGYGQATKYGALTYNGDLQVAGGIVLMLKGSNSKEVIANVKSKIATIQQTLPEGIQIEPFLDRTKMVDSAISTVTTNLLEGALIVIFVLVLFLGNLRAGLLVASVIPLAMLFAIIMMNLFGVSGNLMSLGALDFGLIVDGAVIIVEAVLHSLSKTSNPLAPSLLSRQDTDKKIGQAATKMMNSAVFGQLIILIVYLPILSLQGIEGKMFKPMAQTVAFALIGAFILSVTYVPMMSSLLLQKYQPKGVSFSDKMMSRIQSIYVRLLQQAIRHQVKIIISTVLLLLTSLYLMTKLGGEFIPALPEGDFAVETRVLPGSNLNTSIDAVSKASKILLAQFPEIERVVAKTGTSEVPSDPLPLDVSDMIIVLKERKKWTTASSYQDLEAQMSKALEAIPGVTFSFQYPVAMRFNELISGARQDVVCKIFGPNMDTLAYYAQQLGNISKRVDGADGIYVEAVSGLPQINIRYNRAVLAQYGLNIEAINTVVHTAFAGKVAGTVYEGEKRFDVVLRLNESSRKEENDVSELLIPTPNGGAIPLKNLAQVRVEDGPNQIQRENSARRIIVGFNVRGRDVQSIVQELQQKVQEEIQLPTGYSIVYGGSFENLEAAKSRLYIAVPISLALIFLLLYFAFRSIKWSLLIYTAIPLSAIGGIWALYVRGLSFSISAGVGFIALFGVAVLNGIVLVAEFNRLKNSGYTNLKRVVLTGTSLRLRPVLMTAFVASLGFLPMAISTGEGAEVQRPLATVVIGGLLLATLLTLFILPILYMLLSRINWKPVRSVGTLALLLLPCLANAQAPISLEEALKRAANNNLSLKKEQLKSKYQEKMRQTAWNIPATQLIGEYGQINSFIPDKRLGISQTILFPTVYKRQKELLDATWNSSVLVVGLQEIVLKKQVTQVYIQLVFLHQQKQLLQRQDSIFQQFVAKAKLRRKYGETNALELVSAEQINAGIQQQIRSLLQEEELVTLQFQLLLNTEENLELPNTMPVEMMPVLFDTNSLALHPSLRLLKQQEEESKVAVKVEQAKRLPELTIGYNVMGMKGMGADNKNYNGALQFHATQVGIGIPLATKSQQAQINALKVQEHIAQNNYEMTALQLKQDALAAWKQYNYWKESVAYFEQKALKNAQIIQETAQIQFDGGAIHYLEWSLLMNQAILIQNEYLEAVREQYLAGAHLNYFLPAQSY